MQIVITGGAGFIGTKLARGALAQGHEVVILDNFSPQIHGSQQDLPLDLRSQVGLVRGDVRNRDDLKRALIGADSVVHLAAETGTGQSMYEVSRYSEVNIQGTSLLMDLLVNDRSLAIHKVVVASSRAIYGEGRYHCMNHGAVYPKARRQETMAAGQFEPECPVCGEPCRVEATPETSPLSPSSFYGLTKQVQEQTVLMMSEAIGMDAIALRYQNVYGPGQSLRNPYTGILAIFSGLARRSEKIRIFEDGLESRDFVYIDDVVDATLRALDPSVHGAHAINVGFGEATSVVAVVNEITKFFGSNSAVEVTGEFRIGDIRHNFADVAVLKMVLNYVPIVPFVEGIQHFLAWAAEEPNQAAGYEQSLAELRQRGLMHG